MPQPEEWSGVMNRFCKVVLFTDTDGRARFREDFVPLDQGTPQSMFSDILPAKCCQLRESPVGFRSQFHVTTTPQWVIILSGRMEIGLQDGTARVFGPGEHFYSADLLPIDTLFDASVHGHSSRQLGDMPLRTMFVRD
jgi:hypothetical protein